MLPRAHNLDEKADCPLKIFSGGEKQRLGIARAPEKANKVALEDWFSHLEHTVKLVGPDHVGLGSDFDGRCGFPGMDDVTKIPLITRGLVKRGYNDEDIEKILGGNNLRVMKTVLK